MFVGRKNELIALNQAYEQNVFQFAVVYGRRRVGKTTLINKFVEDKEVIYFCAVEENEKDNLQRFSQAILSFDSPDLSSLSFPNYDEAFQYICEKAKTKRIVLVIDEYPYLAQSYPAISSILQSHIDHDFLNTNLFMILCGSSMSFMENQVLGYKSPLYGRRTLQLKIKPFDFEETCQYFPKMDKESTFIIYSITGGVPQYLSYMSESASIKENIINTFLTPTGPLFEEPSNLLLQELREPGNYNSVIQAIALGSSKLNEISTKIDATTGSTSFYLKNLMDLGILAKIIPVTDAQKQRNKKTLYEISDGMFRFWYAFIPKNVSAIQRGLTELVYQNIEKGLAKFLGKSFEDLSREYLWQHISDKSIVPVPFSQLGMWWGTDNQKKSEIEIDIMGIDYEENIGFFGECKWRNELVDSSVLDKLMYRASLFSYQKKVLYLFSKSGFSTGTVAKAKELDVHLVEFKDM